MSRLPALVAASALLAACVIPLPAPRPAPSPASADLAALERRVHEQVNRHRVARGLPALEFDRDMAAVAREHSRRMSVGEVRFGHSGFDERATLISAVRPYRSISENVAWNNAAASLTAELAVQGWLDSPGHRRNIEGPYRFTGIGVAERGGVYHYTQIFVEPRSGVLPAPTGP